MFPLVMLNKLWAVKFDLMITALNYEHLLLQFVLPLQNNHWMHTGNTSISDYLPEIKSLIIPKRCKMCNYYKSLQSHNEDNHPSIGSQEKCMETQTAGFGQWRKKQHADLTLSAVL